MAKEQYDNSGILFKNDEKFAEGGNPNWPDYKGNATVDGVEYWLSSWIKTGAKGKFMTIALKPKTAKQIPPPPRQPAPQQDDMDDEIPF